MTTSTELLEIARDAFAAATTMATASHAAPAENTATPAVILRPADPWIVPNRRAGPCAEVRWILQLVGGRFELVESMTQLQIGYLAAVAAMRRAGVGQIGPLGLVQPTTIAGQDLLSATFPVTLDYDPGGP